MVHPFVKANIIFNSRKIQGVWNMSSNHVGTEDKNILRWVIRSLITGRNVKNKEGYFPAIIFQMWIMSFKPHPIAICSKDIILSKHRLQNTLKTISVRKVSDLYFIFFAKTMVYFNEERLHEAHMNFFPPSIVSWCQEAFEWGSVLCCRRIFIVRKMTEWLEQRTWFRLFLWQKIRIL